MADPKQLQAQLLLLNDIYAAQLPEKLEEIEQAWTHLLQTAWDDEGFDCLHRLIHNLTGSGKTFGFSLLSDVARCLEQYLKQIIQTRRLEKTATPASEAHHSGTPFDATARSQAIPRVGKAKRAGKKRKVDSTQEVNEISLLTQEQRTHIKGLLRELRQVAMHRDAAFEDQSELMAVAPPRKDEADPNRICIFIVEDDPEFAEEIKVQLGYFGYDVSVFSTLADFRLAMQDAPNVVVLMDIAFPEDSLAGVQVMKEIQQGRATPIPVVFLTAHYDLASRLEAVRAGGIAFLPKPINISNLIDKLDVLTTSLPPAPYRVLIVDDLPALTTYYAAVLEQAGMEVRVVNNPLEVMEPLLEFAPDLILLDVYMPECNGMELAKAIRQLDAFVSIPVVFLSAERDFDKQLLAIGQGGDDFLTKPIEPEHLVSSLTSRIQRSLLLRSFMVHDSLTGLLNHTTIKDQLEREVARSKRQGAPLAFAMVDIDHFKHVNDTYGHPAGDRVIKSLARLLKQRLRKTDQVGRYGGEEFALILSDADEVAGAKVLDTIRHDFSKLRHLANGKEFSVSFSVGVADVAHFSVTSRLFDAADRALYKAKRAGRNQVQLASGKTDEVV